MSTAEPVGLQKPTGRKLWDDDLWDALLASIARRRVIPIIGPALSVVEFRGETMPLDHYIALQLQERLHLDIDTPLDAITLDDVVSAHLRANGLLQDLYVKIHSILRESQFEALKIPDHLVKLAQITDFNLYVTTAFDPFLQRALDQERGGGSKVTECIGYTPSEMPDCDLKFRLEKIGTPTVYHLLGKSSVFAEFVISDDDLLEYLFALQSDKQPVQLFDELGRHNLLILGGNFPDWLFRIFLRVTKRQRLSDPRRPSGDREFLADERARLDDGFVGFLANFSPQTRVYHGSPPEFIDELWSRWNSTARPATPGRQAPAAAGREYIFISYSREDAVAAANMKAGLIIQGYDVWLDQEELGAGVYDDRIQAAIAKARIFLPLISANTERDVRGAFFRREWKWAIEADTRMAASVGYLLPVVVDGTSRGQLNEVPPQFLQQNIFSSEGGVVSSEISRALQAAMRSGR
jgi:hypothetical protein